MLLAKHVSQIFVQRKHLVNVSGNVGGGDDSDTDDAGDATAATAADDNDNMPKEDFRKLFGGMLSSVTINLKLFSYFLPFDIKQCGAP